MSENPTQYVGICHLPIEDAAIAGTDAAGSAFGDAHRCNWARFVAAAAAENRVASN